MRKYFDTLLNGVMAGILISIGGSVFLACENKVVGAVLFCVALLCICYKGYYLFTGKVGYIPLSHSQKEIVDLFVGLLGNAIGTVVIGEALRFAIPTYEQTALTICTAKLSNSFLQGLAKGFMCGVLMYLAVSVFKENNKNPIGILFCIPTFILCGFEHSIADIYYFAVSGIVSLDAVWFLLTIVLGNALGGMVLPAITKLLKKEN